MGLLGIFLKISYVFLALSMVLHILPISNSLVKKCRQLVDLLVYPLTQPFRNLLTTSYDFSPVIALIVLVYLIDPFIKLFL